MDSFTLYPAIDVRGGRIVRLAQGDYAQETRYGDDPLALAREYAAQGARWLHLVDLDAARSGGYTLATLVGRIAGEAGLQVQTGGGVRSREDVQRILDAGAARVVVGSLAVREADMVAGWIEEFGAERITVALDTRRDREGTWRLPVHGWTETAAGTLQEMARRYAQRGLRHLLCTDISRDGMLRGPALELYTQILAKYPELHLIASGGVSSLKDLDDLKAAGLPAAILGKAIYEGRIQLKDLSKYIC